MTLSRETPPSDCAAGILAELPAHLALMARDIGEWQQVPLHSVIAEAAHTGLSQHFEFWRQQRPRVSTNRPV